MKTISNVLQQMTDPNAIVHALRETLREIDPRFPDAEGRALAAEAALEKALGDTMTPSVRDFLAAKEEELAAELIYLGWQGFQLNLDIFRNPVNALLFRGDFEELLRERRLGSLPMAGKPRAVQEAFYSALPVEKHPLTVEITSFYSYLATYGYKIAHYFGFRLADRFLPYIVPGYISDNVNTSHYASGLRAYLQVDLDRLA